MPDPIDHESLQLLDLVSVVVVAVSINTRTRVKVSEVASSKTG